MLQIEDDELRWLWTITRVLQRQGEPEDEQQGIWTANLVGKLEDEMARRRMEIATKL